MPPGFLGMPFAVKTNYLQQLKANQRATKVAAVAKPPNDGGSTPLGQRRSLKTLQTLRNPRRRPLLGEAGDGLIYKPRDVKNYQLLTSTHRCDDQQSVGDSQPVHFTARNP